MVRLQSLSSKKYDEDTSRPSLSLDKRVSIAQCADNNEIRLEVFRTTVVDDCKAEDLRKRETERGLMYGALCMAPNLG